jgi:hypothetical protein
VRLGHAKARTVSRSSTILGPEGIP